MQEEEHEERKEGNSEHHPSNFWAPVLRCPPSLRSPYRRSWPDGVCQLPCIGL